MNYKVSKKILEEIKKAKKILINLHRGPDLDSIGSALAMNYVLKHLVKETQIVCSSDTLYENLSFLKDYKKIKAGIDFNNFDYKKYDLFLCLDSSTWGMISSDSKIPLPSIPMIVIDHHHTNERYGYVNLVDEKCSAVGELLYKIFEDWNIKIDKNIATALLTGIIGDTGIFKYPNTSGQTFDISNKLMKAGADKDLIIKNVYRNYDFNLIKYWGDVISRIEIDKKHKFVYSFIPYEIYEKWGKPENGKEFAVDLFAQTTKGTDFGIMGLEKEKNLMSISLRARTNFDTSLIAKELKGGGHKAASGGMLEGIEFNKAVEKVLQVARKYAKKN